MNNVSGIIRDFERVPARIAKEAANFQPAILADVASRRGAMHGLVKALRPNMKVAGTAFTVEVRPGDNLMIHAAMAMAKPGDVLVIDGKGDQTAALMGAVMMTACKKLGIAGAVIYGAARDSSEIEEIDFPVFSVGTNPNGPTMMVPGRIGHPVSVGGVMVHAGDFVIGDADGVVVVEREKVEELLSAAARKVKDEAARIEAIKAGDTSAKWLVPALRAASALKDGKTRERHSHLSRCDCSECCRTPGGLSVGLHRQHADAA